MAVAVTTVSGQVFDGSGRPAVAGFVTLSGSDDGTGAHMAPGQIVRPDGRFLLSGVAPGDYTLNVHAFFDEGEMMRLVSTGTLDQIGVTLPLAVSGTPIEDLRIVVPPPLEIAGRLVFEGPPPKPGVTATIFAGNSRGEMYGDIRTPVGPDGRFTLRLRPGTWCFSAWTPGKLLSTPTSERAESDAVALTSRSASACGRSTTRLRR